MLHKRLLLAALLAVLCAGCEADDRYCKLGATRVVAHTRAKWIDGIALEPMGKAALLAWSDSGGVYARVLDAQGAPIAEPVRLGERCEAGIALSAAASARDVQLACARRAIARDAASTGHVQLYAIERGRADATPVIARELSRVTPAGTLSQGVALAHVRGGVALAWHDASPDVHRVWLALPGKAAQVVSTLGRLAEAPALLADRGEALLAWTERFASERPGEDAAITAILVQRGGGKPVVVRSHAHLSAMPQLVRADEGEGGLVLAFRGQGGGGLKVGLHLSRLSSALRAEKPQRIGRAEGPGRPVLLPCMRGLVTATPRTYSGDFFVGLNWLSPALHKPRREQQFYEDAHAFTQAAAACMGERALIALAELPMLDRAQAALHVAQYACE